MPRLLTSMGGTSYATRRQEPDHGPAFSGAPVLRESTTLSTKTGLSTASTKPGLSAALLPSVPNAR